MDTFSNLQSKSTCHCHSLPCRANERQLATPQTPAAQALTGQMSHGKMNTWSSFSLHHPCAGQGRAGLV